MGAKALTLGLWPPIELDHECILYVDGQPTKLKGYMGVHSLAGGVTL